MIGGLAHEVVEGKSAFFRERDANAKESSRAIERDVHRAED